MSKYKVILRTDTPNYPRPDSDWNLALARELKEQFGLEHLTLAEVKEAWEQFSEENYASWLKPNKADVEYVFGVRLQVIEEFQTHSGD